MAVFLRMFKVFPATCAENVAPILRIALETRSSRAGVAGHVAFRDVEAWDRRDPPEYRDL